MTKATKSKTRKEPVRIPAVSRVLPEIRSLIKELRQYVATTANLTLVNLYWNIGRVITQDIQKNEKRAGYGKQLLQGLAGILTREYDKGFSVSNLNDMRRFSGQHGYPRLGFSPTDFTARKEWLLRRAILV